MDKEQAIDLLDNLIGMIEDNQDNDYDTAFRMAIDALKAQLFSEGTTSDTISRQAAIDVASGYCHPANIAKELAKLPTAQPEPKEGHWIPHESPDGGEQYECSRCGVLWEFNDGTPEDNEAYFCPKCGAKMTISTK